MINQNFTVVRGDSLQFRLNFVDTNTPPNALYFSLKDKSSDTTVILQKSLGNGITKVSNQLSYDFYLEHSDTNDLKLNNYIYQILALYGSEYETLVEGKLIITPEV